MQTDWAAFSSTGQYTFPNTHTVNLLVLFHSMSFSATKNAHDEVSDNNACLHSWAELSQSKYCTWNTASHIMIDVEQTLINQSLESFWVPAKYAHEYTLAMNNNLLREHPLSDYVTRGSKLFNGLILCKRGGGRGSRIADFLRNYKMDAPLPIQQYFASDVWNNRMAVN